MLIGSTMVTDVVFHMLYQCLCKGGVNCLLIGRYQISRYLSVLVIYLQKYIFIVQVT